MLKVERNYEQSWGKLCPKYNCIMGIKSQGFKKMQSTLNFREGYFYRFFKCQGYKLLY